MRDISGLSGVCVRVLFFADAMGMKPSCGQPCGKPSRSAWLPPPARRCSSAMASSVKLLPVRGHTSKIHNVDPLVVIV